MVAQVQAGWTAALGPERTALLLDALRELVEPLGVACRGIVKSSNYGDDQAAAAQLKSATKNGTSASRVS